jgi:hypothetical protein
VSPPLPDQGVGRVRVQGQCPPVRYWRSVLVSNTRSRAVRS